MKRPKHWLDQQLILCLVVVLASPMSVIAQAQSTSQISGMQQSSAPVVPASSPQDVQSPSAAPAPGQTPQTQTSGSGGTAAAPEMNPSGSPASRPAGAAVAAAKQKRVRTFAIRTALVVGAAVAIGVVVGASLGSPSKPH